MERTSSLAPRASPQRARRAISTALSVRRRAQRSMLARMTTPAVPPAFRDLGLIDPLLAAIAKQGYERPTPIQSQSIPHVLAGSDVLGCAQTGTGKTAAFALPILQRLSASRARATHVPRVLVLAPTRELATQIGESFSAYGRGLQQRTAVIFGGVGQGPQATALRRGVDIVVATPGRLLDLLNQRILNLSGIEILVLDEADRMLDMGFLPDVRRILAAVPKKRQSLLFSATMPPEIRKLAGQILSHPVEIAVTPVATTAEKIAQLVYFCEKRDKQHLLEHLLSQPEVERALVFTRTKREANKVATALEGVRIGAEAIHGNKSQGQRERALGGFKDGSVRVLVATDIAARGIDVEGITHVINMDIPDAPESYVHRIGRTARAGASGIAYSLCSSEERDNLRDIERLIRMPIPVGVGPRAPAGAAQRSADPAPRRHESARSGYGQQSQRGGAGRGGSGGGAAGRGGAAHGGARHGGSQRDGGRSQGRPAGGSGYGHAKPAHGGRGQGGQGTFGGAARPAANPATPPRLGFSDRGRGGASNAPRAPEFGQFEERKHVEPRSEETHARTSAAAKPVEPHKPFGVTPHRGVNKPAGPGKHFGGRSPQQPPRRHR
jgi:ATP-dependent RNA helicase RhlE